MWGAGPKTLQGSTSTILPVDTCPERLDGSAGGASLATPWHGAPRHPLGHPWEVLLWVGSTCPGLCPYCLAALETGALCWGDASWHLHPPIQVLIILPGDAEVVPARGPCRPSVCGRSEQRWQQGQLLPVPLLTQQDYRPAGSHHTGGALQHVQGHRRDRTDGHRRGQTATLAQNSDATGSICTGTPTSASLPHTPVTLPATPTASPAPGADTNLGACLLLAQPPGMQVGRASPCCAAPARCPHPHCYGRSGLGACSSG